MIPLGMRSNSDLSIWCLRLNKESEERLAGKVALYNEVEQKAKESEQKRVLLDEGFQVLDDEVKMLRKARPLKYLFLKAKFFSATKKLGSLGKNNKIGSS